MGIKVTYRQKGLVGAYRLVRVIDFTPNRRFFKVKTEQNVLSNAKISNEEYVKSVRIILNYTDEELIEAIQPVLKNYVYDPIDISYDVSQYERELEVDLDK